MRTFNIISSLALLVAALSLSPTAHFNGRPQQRDTVTAPPSGQDANPASVLEIGRATPLAAVPIALSGFERSATQALQGGHTEQAISELEYAADQGAPTAQWTLGRMYADGEGVEKNRLRAFVYFSRLAKSHAEDAPGTKQARLVANAFVLLGQYYLEGIPNSSVSPIAIKRANCIGMQPAISPIRTLNTISDDFISIATAASAIRVRLPNGLGLRHAKASIKRRLCSGRCCSKAGTSPAMQRLDCFG